MICHVDMDAFFASVEQLDNPSLAGKCVIVGGVSDRGVVSAASYEARKFGVHSAMPVFQAKIRCPSGIFLPPRIRRYKELSEIVMETLSSFSPVLEQVSIDEAFLDLSGCQRLFGPYDRIGARIKEAIKSRTKLNCSVGIAPLKFLAKIASDMDKPDGLCVIAPEAVKGVLRSLPVSKVPGVGPVTEKTLERMGIRFLGDVEQRGEKEVVARLGRFGHRLYELSTGTDRSAVTPARPIKSISSEETLAVDTRDKHLLENLLLKHAEDVARQARRKGLLARTVFIKLKDVDFKQVTRQAPLSEPTHSSERIFKAGAALLTAYPLQKPIRLAGLGVSDLLDAGTPVQRSLFENNISAERKWEQIGAAIDAIESRFGTNIVQKARLCTKKTGEE